LRCSFKTPFCHRENLKNLFNRDEGDERDKTQGYSKLQTSCF
jgi:hypothetical protein